MLNLSLLEEQQSYYLTHNSCEDEGVPTFCKDINTKVNIILWLVFEQSFNDFAVLYIRY